MSRMAGISSSDDPLREMSTLASTAITLSSQLEAVISSLSKTTSVSETKATDTASGTGTGTVPPGSDLDALAIARDSASLIKAHATKISLFIINKPFTPTAISKVLRDLVSGPLPALASAAQLCDSKRYTQAVSRDLAWRCGRVLKEFRELVQRIPTDGDVLSDAKRNASFGSGAEKGSVATTGLLWSACDDVVALASLGVAGHLIRKVEQFRDTLKDIMEELKEWSEEESDEDEEEDEEEDVEQNAHGSHDEDEAAPADSASSPDGEHLAARTPTTQDILDDIMNSHSHIPRDDPDRIRRRLDSCLRRIRLTVLLYQATIKRRLKTLPPLPTPRASEGRDTISRLDEVISLLKLLPERFGSLALAFYDLDRDQIDSLTDQCFLEAFAVSELLVKGWDGKKDEFTDWALKYQIEIKKT